MYLESQQVRRVSLEGAMIVRNIHAAHDRLREALVEHSTVELDCEAVTEFDLSFIQLLLSARRSASISGKSLALTTPAAGKLRGALGRAGFLPETDEGAGSDGIFWLKGSSVS